MSNVGTFAIVSGDLTRYADSMAAIIALKLPPNIYCYWGRGVNVAQNLNNAIRAMQGDWIFFMGDDHVHAPDIVQRLEAHKVDVVAPLVARRNYPFMPVAYSRWVRENVPRPTPWNEVPPHGLMEVVAGTNAGMLVRKYVLDAIGDPWFEVGQMGRTDMLSEDIHFYKKAQAAGFKCYVDVDTHMGHVTPMTIWPPEDHGTGVDIEVSQNIKFPVRYTEQHIVDTDGRTPV